MADRKNIKLQKVDYERLKEQKPDGVTWGYYLTEIRTVD